MWVASQGPLPAQPRAEGPGGRGGSAGTVEPRLFWKLHLPFAQGAPPPDDSILEKASQCAFLKPNLLRHPKVLQIKAKPSKTTFIKGTF